MRTGWLPALTVVLLLGGCGSENGLPPDESAHPQRASKPASPPPESRQRPAQTAAQPMPKSSPPVKTFSQGRVVLPYGEGPDVHFDRFGLPLVIDIEAPEVPKELLGPSPPIQEPPPTPPTPPAPKPPVAKPKP